MKTLIFVGMLLMPLVLASAQDADLLESARQLERFTGKVALSEEAVKTLTLENRRLRAQVEAVAARCP